MNKEEFTESRRRIKSRAHDDDPTGLNFAYWSLLTWERARTVKIVKSCAKQAFKDVAGPDHWKVHSFMTLLGKRVRASIIEDDGESR